MHQRDARCPCHAGTPVHWTVLRYLTPQLVVLTGWKLLSYYIDSSSTLDKFSKY